MGYTAIGAAVISAGTVLAPTPPDQLQSANEAFAAQYVAAHVSCPAGKALASWQYRDGVDITTYLLITVKQEGTSPSASVDCSGDQYSLNGSQLTVLQVADYAAATIDQARKSAVAVRKHDGGMPVIDGTVLHELELQTQQLKTSSARSGNQNGNEQRQ